MFTVLTRTANRPNFFAICRYSVLQQTISAHHIVSTDDPGDTYPEADQVIQVERLVGRGHNLYLNTMRLYVPVKSPWVIIIDDDDHFVINNALEIIKNHIVTEDNIILWRVYAPNRGTIPDTRHFGKQPVFGQITGIGFCIHVKNWVNWSNIAGSDFLVIDTLYRRLQPVWIDEILTAFQSGHGGGQRIDKKNYNGIY